MDKKKDHKQDEYDFYREVMKKKPLDKRKIAVTAAGVAAGRAGGGYPHHSAVRLTRRRRLCRAGISGGLRPDPRHRRRTCRGGAGGADPR